VSLYWNAAVLFSRPHGADQKMEGVPLLVEIDEAALPVV